MKTIFILLSIVLTIVTTPVSAAAQNVTGTITDWSKYSSTYFYDQMTANEKELYDGLTNAANKAMNSTNYITEIRAEYHDLTVDEYTRVEQVWLETEAQYFFIHGYGGNISTSGTAQMLLLPEYYDGTARQAARKKFEANINRYINEAWKGRTDYDKEKIIHDILVKRLKYGDTGDSYAGQTSASSLIGNKTVCAGYAAAFSVLMNGLGVPTITVTDVTHAWNKIRLGNKWYLVDVTYDDPGGPNGSDYPDGSNMTYNYFNISDATAKIHDKENYSGGHNATTEWHGYKVPLCKEDRIILWGNKNYKVRRGDWVQIYFSTNSPTKKITWKFSNNHTKLLDNISDTDALVTGNSKGATTVMATIRYKNGIRRTRKFRVTVR